MRPPPHGDTEDILAAQEGESLPSPKNLLPRQRLPPRIDAILVMAKCLVPAMFVVISAVVAIPLNSFLGPQSRSCLEQIAGGALIGTFAFELTKGYMLHDHNGAVDYKLVACTLVGTVFSGQIQTAAQGFWPYVAVEDLDEPAFEDGKDEDELDSGQVDSITFGDSVPFALAFFVDGVVLGYETQRRILPIGSSVWERARPALTSTLTYVVSIDNAIEGIGLYQKLDEDTMPTWVYYMLFVSVIFLGGLLTIAVRLIASDGLQAAWFAFGAFSILDGGLELSREGMTTWVLLGFLIVWAILLLGANQE
mmetsp:Transcript_8730/g.14663  ORF Transcript_8730/g.14663 Transcript_8730/m.14663 type:complete len:308 (+) Transcript_8730:76-999(+)|eukprot:CAMPEP_0119324366 /NCGR_PEP_ID=MMETSP1333-20130426/63038_1 /TAXON_ID=418940 /ORGANISM="Scyphosphaera apsteinii, Strain RCC1455" /LENGTH=307 /DNA_ID=CAMNT_0007332053 /DNA_START=70 /DNA_END=993 /DNA_ORIENTATION=+